MKKGILLSLLLSAGSVVADPAEPRPAPPAFERGEEPLPDMIDDAPCQIQVTVEFIEVPQEDATRLLYKEKLGKDGDKLRETLQQMVDTGKGKIVEAMGVAGRSGQKITSESISEMIYPTEYEEPGLPGSFTNEKDRKSTGGGGKVSAIPTAFETRNVGSTLEVEPTLGVDNHTIDLRLVPELVFHAGRSLFQQQKDELGNESTVEMPLFYTMRTNTSLTLYSGAYQFVSLLSPKTEGGATDPSRKVFVMVCADTVVVKAGKTK